MPKEIKHAPIPWGVLKLDSEEYWFDGKHYNAGPAIVLDKEDAEFIVRACNSYYELLEIAKETLNHYGEKAEYCDDVIKSCEYMDIVRALQAAIAKAEGK